MSNDIYLETENILKSRRISAELTNQQRIDEINSKIPEIYEINKILFNTSKELYQIISKGYDVEKKIEELKNSNLEAQKFIRDILKIYGYPEDYLDIQYDCNDCNDTGYLNDGDYCHCFNTAYRKIAAKKFNNSSHIKLTSFDTFSLSYYRGNDFQPMSKIFNLTKNYAENFSLKSDNLLMFGKTGLGKTHLSLAIANVVIGKGYSVIYDSAINILHKIEREHFGRDKDNDTISLILDTDLLLLDDLGTEFESSFYTSTIYNIVNTRLNKNLPTIISTNLSVSELNQRYEERVVSRLTTMYTCMEFVGDDVRHQKKLETQT